MYEYKIRKGFNSWVLVHVLIAGGREQNQNNPEQNPKPHNTR